MKIITADFVTSAVNAKGYPVTSIPEVAFAGRSNVGKSSLLNMLVRRKKLARTSREPGRTQLINFFIVNENFHMVDLPGYGFAKVPQRVKEQWGEMVEGYLQNRPNLRGVVLLVDVRHDPTNLDLQMYHWLCHYQVPTAVALTKTDKLSKSQLIKQTARIKKVLQLQQDHQLVITSSQTRTGREELLQVIGNWIS